MEELGNPFEEESEDLLVLDCRIADPSAVEAVQKAQKIGQQQFQTVIEECFVEREQSPLMTQSIAIG